MANVESFFELESAVLAELPRRWGPFRRFVVPERTFAYVVESNDAAGGFTVAAGGTVRLDGGRTVWLVRDGRWRLSVRMADLRAADDVRFVGEVALDVELPARTSDLRRFFGGRPWPARTDAEIVAGRLEPGLRETLGARLGEDPIGALYALSPEEVRARLRERGEEVLIERGLDLRGVARFSVSSADYDDIREREVELRLEEERVRQRLRFLDLWKRQEVGERLARREVDAIVHHLRERGVVRAAGGEIAATQPRGEALRDELRSEQQLRHLLAEKDLEHSLAIDGQRLEAEIAATQRVSEALREEGIEGAIFRLDDENLKGRLYRLLLEKEMSPEQIRARAGASQAEDLSDLGRSLQAVVEEAREVLDRVKSIPAAARVEDEPALDDDPPARRLLAAAGKDLLVLEDAHAGATFAPLESFAASGLGYLRSLRRGDSAGTEFLLVGAQHGVHALPSRGGSPRRYLLPAHDGRRGGVNASCSVDNHLYATHSEHGLVRWLVSEEGRPGEVVVAASAGAAGGAESIRGVQAGPGGWIWYARGSTVRALDPRSAAEEARFEAGAEVTSLTVDEERLLAGTADGRLLLWRGFDARPELVLHEPDRPVYSVFALRRGGRDLVLVGAGTRHVTALDIAAGEERTLRAPQPVTWVRACGRSVYAVARSAHVLFVWSWALADGVPRAIPVEERVVDLLPVLPEARHPGERSGFAGAVRRESAP